MNQQTQPGHGASAPNLTAARQPVNVRRVAIALLVALVVTAVPGWFALRANLNARVCEGSALILTSSATAPQSADEAGMPQHCWESGGYPEEIERLKAKEAASR